MKKIYLFLITLILSISCQKEDNFVRDEQYNIDKIEVENGILSFSSKEFLDATIKDLKESTKEEKQQKLNKFYDKGFMPLFPQFHENDISRFQEFSNRKKKKLQKLTDFKRTASLSLQARTIPTEIDEDGELVEEFDDNLISDDEFASFINDSREIIINDTLYKFTHSGMFSVHKTEKSALDSYIQTNNIDYLVPDASTIVRGETNPTPIITQSIPTVSMIRGNFDKCAPGFYEANVADAFGPNSDCTEEGGGGNSGGGGTNPPPPPVDHTLSLVDLIDNLGPCDTITGFLDGVFQVFGVSRKCYANHSDKYRTKTKYWKENYIIWNSIGVKVKHQKKGWTGLWRAKSTNEVALSISQASFKYTIDIPGFPESYAPPKFYFFENKIFNSQAQLQNYSNAIYRPPFPEIPFVSEVVVTEFLSETPGVDISVEKMRELFYQGVWEGAKAIVQHYKNRQPKNVTHIIYTPTTVYLNYVDLERRKLNTKKIVNTLDYNFGLGFKFNVNIDAQGNYSTDITSVGDALGNLIIPKLYDYDDVKMDFVGATRRGNTWKGSRIVYTDD